MFVYTYDLDFVSCETGTCPVPGRNKDYVNVTEVVSLYLVPIALFTSVEWEKSIVPENNLERH